jgi:hypothetical protein
MLDPLEQARAVDDVVGTLRDGDGAQVANDHVGVSGPCVIERPLGQRVVGVDGGDRNLEPVLGELTDAEFPQRSEAAGLQQGDRPAEAAHRVVVQRLGEEPVRLHVRARRITASGSHRDK